MDKPLFSTRCTLKQEHLEEGQLEHQAVIGLMKKVRIGFLESHGMTEKCIVPGVGFVIGDLKVRYIKPARENDTLDIVLNITKPKEGEKRCTVSYQIKKAGEDTLRRLEKITFPFMGMIMYNYFYENRANSRFRRHSCGVDKI